MCTISGYILWPVSQEIDLGPVYYSLLVLFLAMYIRHYNLRIIYCKNVTILTENMIDLVLPIDHQM